MIQIDSLGKVYHTGSDEETRALTDISLSIRPGDFTTIVGTSGSGKTTLLNIIGGLDREYTGSVSVDGSDNLADLSEDQLAHLRNRVFGFVFQQFHLLHHLTAAENVALPSYFGETTGSRRSPHTTRSDGQPNATGRTNDWKSTPKRAHELLERVGLGDRRHAHPGDLSGGQRQRVAIARALFRRPRYLLCDEPTGSLDRNTGRDVMSLFDTLNRESNVAVIIVTHEEHVARRTNRRIRLEGGSLVADDPVEAFDGDATDLVDTDRTATDPAPTEPKAAEQPTDSPPTDTDDVDGESP